MGSQKVRHDWVTSLHFTAIFGLPRWLSGKESTCQCRRRGFKPWVGKIPWRRERLPTPVFWPGEFHGLYSPWGRKESDMTERLSQASSWTHPWISITFSTWISSRLLKLNKSESELMFLSQPYMTTGKTIALTLQTLVGKAMSLLFNTLSSFVIAIIPRSERLLISRLQSLSSLIL